MPGIHFVHFPNNAIISLYDGLLVTGTQVSIASGSEIVKQVRYGGGPLRHPG